MKKLACYLLIVWLALVSGCVSVHSASEAAHEALHTAQTQTADSHTSASADSDHLQAEHASTCHQSQCGHGHCAGVLAPLGAFQKAGTAANVPMSRSCWASAAITDNIERPKWLATAPAVVSLLN